MRGNHRKRYDDGFRHDALRLIRAGVGRDPLAHRLVMPRRTAEKDSAIQVRRRGSGHRRQRQHYDWGK